MLLGILRHVDADHRRLVVEQELRERLRELGLADTRRTQEQERTQGTIRIGDARPRTAYRIGHRHDRSLLADQALADMRLHREQLLGFALHHPPDGYAGPGRHHLGDIARGDLLGNHRLVRLLLLIGLRHLSLERRDLPIEQLRRPAEIALALSPLGLTAQLVDLGTQLTDLVEARLLGLPARLEPAQLLLGVLELLLQAREPLLGGRVFFLRQSELLHGHAIDIAPQLVDLLR